MKNETVLVVAFMVAFFVAAMLSSARGHGIHLNDYTTGDPVIAVEPGSFDGMSLKGTDGKCYITYISGEQVANDHRQLHIREVPCK